MDRADGLESVIIGGLQLDLTRYRQPLGHFARTFPPHEVGGDVDGYQIVAPVELEFDVHKDKDKFRLVGRVRTELELSCSRCLEPYRFPIDAVFLDKRLVVRKVAPDVRPWRLRFARGARSVLELAAGEAGRRGLAAGQQLSLKE